jgi:predicted acetyltransferase
MAARVSGGSTLADGKAYGLRKRRRRITVTSAMTVDVREVAPADHKAVERMMELYQHDFSEFDDHDLEPDGLYHYPDLELYWSEPAYRAHVVTVAGKWAGFALSSDDVRCAGCQRSLDEFFVIRKYRRRGVGQRVAMTLFDQIPARWEVRVHHRNAPAATFWHKILARYTAGAFEDARRDDDPWHRAIFTFQSRAALIG